jgi:hypothetical protein
VIANVPHPYHPFGHALGRIPDADAVEVYNSKHLFGLANGRAKLEASFWKFATKDTAVILEAFKSGSDEFRLVRKKYLE